MVSIPKPDFHHGLLDLNQLLTRGHAALLPHTPEWFSPNCLPYRFDGGASCATWLQFLNEVLESDAERIALLQEWFGYCLIPDTRQQKFLVLEGEGANGKTVVLDVLTGVVGVENVSQVPLEVFGQRFQLTSTLGKLVNIASEVEGLGSVAEGTLKQFTGGDRMYFDRKGIAGLEAYPTARLTLAANNRPRFRDKSMGLWRRMIVMPFRVTIPEERRDLTLTERLLTELPGIFNWAVEGLRRLRAQGRLTMPLVCREVIEEYRRKSNPARLFLEDRCRKNLKAHVAVGELYGEYAEWTRAFGHKPLAETQFGKEVRRAFPHMQRKKRGPKGQRYWAYVGIRFLRPQGPLAPQVVQVVP